MEEALGHFKMPIESVLPWPGISVSATLLDGLKVIFYRPFFANSERNGVFSANAIFKRDWLCLNFLSRFQDHCYPRCVHI
jgi:hypothetical protein